MSTRKYVEILDTKNGSDADACKFNCHILAEEVAEIECTSAGKLTEGELLDYTPFIPFDHYFSCVERYANGARNFFVRNQDDKVVGYLIVRPSKRGE